MDKSEEGRRVLVDFREATRELEDAYSLFPKSCGLSQAEYWSLVLIYEGAATQSQISGQLYLSRQTLNSAIKQLREKDMLRLEPFERNQRSKQLLLTEKGRAFVEDHVARMHQVEERAWKGLTPEEQVLLTQLTRRFSGLIRQEMEAGQKE